MKNVLVFLIIKKIKIENNVCNTQAIAESNLDNVFLHFLLLIFLNHGGFSEEIIFHLIFPKINYCLASFEFFQGHRSLMVTVGLLESGICKDVGFAPASVHLVFFVLSAAETGLLLVVKRNVVMMSAGVKIMHQNNARRPLNYRVKKSSSLTKFQLQNNCLSVKMIKKRKYLFFAQLTYN